MPPLHPHRGPLRLPRLAGCDRFALPGCRRSSGAAVASPRGLEVPNGWALGKKMERIHDPNGNPNDKSPSYVFFWFAKILLQLFSALSKGMKNGKHLRKQHQIFHVDRRIKQDKQGQKSALSTLTVGIVFDITWIIIVVKYLRICNINRVNGARMRSLQRYKLHKFHIAFLCLPHSRHFPTSSLIPPGQPPRSWSQLNCSHGQGQDWGINPFTLILNVPPPPPPNKNTEGLFLLWGCIFIFGGEAGPWYETLTTKTTIFDFKIDQIHF